MSCRCYILTLNYLVLLTLGLRSDSFICIWLVMEISRALNIFILYMVKENGSNVLNYFIIQSISSLILLLIWILNYQLVFILMMAAKFGIYPFADWFIIISKNLRNFSFVLIRVLQKFLPMLLMRTFGANVITSLIFGTIRAIFVGLSIGTTNDLRITMIISSIFNSSWLLVGRTISLQTTIILLVVYGVRLVSLLYTNHVGYRQTIYLSILSVRGLPPFPVFFAKLQLIYKLIDQGTWIQLILFARLSVIYNQITFIGNSYTYTGVTGNCF